MPKIMKTRKDRVFLVFFFCGTGGGISMRKLLDGGRDLIGALVKIQQLPPHILENLENSK